MASAWDTADVRAEADIDPSHASDRVAALFQEAGWTQVKQVNSEDAFCVLGVKP